MATGVYSKNPAVQIRGWDDTALNVDANGNLIVRLTDGTDLSSLDPVDGALVTTTLDHHQVHDGVFYAVSGRTIDLGSGDSIDLLLCAPATPDRIHAVIGFQPSAAGFTELWEGATGLLSGSTLTAYNNDRNSANATVLTVYNEPASLTLATAAKIETIEAGASKNNQSGRSVRGGGEWILKQGTDYIARFVSDSANNDVSFEIQYYEV